MKICFVVQNFPCFSETFILTQIIKLLERGHKVCVFSFHHSEDILPENFVSDYALHQKTIYYRRVPKRQILRLGTFAFQTILCALNNWRFLVGLWRQPDIPPYAKVNLVVSFGPLIRFKPELFYCQFGPLGVRVLELGKLMNIPIVTAIRGFDITRYLQEFGHDVYRELYKHGRLFLPVCEALGRKLKENGCPIDKIKILRTGLDLSLFSHPAAISDSQNKYQVLTIGRLTEKKGIEFLIRAVKILKDQNILLKCAIIGDGPLRAHLAQLTQKLNVIDQVSFLGKQSHQDVIRHLQQTNIFVLPSVTAKDGDQEGIPNVLKEAMASGVAVIATDHSGNAELIKNGVNGILVPQRDAQTLAENISRLLDDRQLRGILEKNARRTIEEEFDIEKTMDALENIFFDIVKH